MSRDKVIKILISDLPKGKKKRVFSKVEAAFSIQIDYSSQNKVTISGYAKQWQWSKAKVYKFFEDMGISIKYPDGTKTKQNQRGIIKPTDNRLITDRSENENRLMATNKINNLNSAADRSENENRPITDRSPVTSYNIYTAKDCKNKKTTAKEPCYITKTGKKLTGKRLESFNKFWKIFNYKKGKAEAAEAWFNIPELTNSLVDKILFSAKKTAQERQGLIDSGLTPKMAQGWITARRWEDEESETPDIQVQPEDYIFPEDQEKARQKQSQTWTQ